MHLLVIYMSSLEKHLLKSVGILIGLLIYLCMYLLLLDCRTSLYIFAINPLPDIQFTNISSHIIGWIFILLIVYFAVQKLYSTM